MRYAIRRLPVVLGLVMLVGLCAQGSAYAGGGSCVRYVEGGSADALIYNGSGDVSIQGVPGGTGYSISTTPVNADCVKPPCRIETVDGVADPTHVFCPSRAAAPQTVRVVTGDGPDSVTLWDFVKADVTIHTHGGDDRVTLDYYSPGGAGAGETSVATGSGNDSFTVGLCERLYYRHVTAGMGAGDDTVLLGRGEGTLTTGCAASIDGDGGDDDITTWSFGEVRGGGGDDTIRSRGTNLGRASETFLYDGGPGADQILDATRSFPWFLTAIPVRLRGGAGPDSIDGGGSPLSDTGGEPGAFGIPDDIDCGPGRDIAVSYERDTRVGC